MTYSLNITREKRKTVSLQVVPPNNIIVKAPLRCPDKFISSVVAKRKDWIEKKFQEHNTYSYFLSYKHSDVGHIYFLGRAYPIRKDRVKTITLTDHHLVIPFHATSKEIELWYKKEARKLFLIKTEVIAKQMGLSYNTIRIKTLTSRWGSCSSKKNLNFNWKLILFEPQYMRYVIIHECAHLKFMDHSKSFWSLVQHHDRNFKKHHRELRKRGFLLSV